LSEIPAQTPEQPSPVEYTPLDLKKLREFASRARDVDEFIVMIRTARGEAATCQLSRARANGEIRRQYFKQFNDRLSEKALKRIKELLGGTGFIEELQKPEMNQSACVGYLIKTYRSGAQRQQV